MAFLLPLLSTSEIFSEDEEPPPLAKTKKVCIELPKGADSKAHEYGVTISICGMNVDFIPMDKETFNYSTSMFRLSDTRFLRGQMVSEVQFGNAHGLKVVTVNWRCPDEKLGWQYYFEVPGGYVSAVISSATKKVDESCVEDLFHSLQVVDRKRA